MNLTKHLSDTLHIAMCSYRHKLWRLLSHWFPTYIRSFSRVNSSAFSFIAITDLYTYILQLSSRVQLLHNHFVGGTEYYIRYRLTTYGCEPEKRIFRPVPLAKPSAVHLASLDLRPFTCKILHFSLAFIYTCPVYLQEVSQPLGYMVSGFTPPSQCLMSRFYSVHRLTLS